MKSGIGIIAAERQRQLTEEGWTREHDAGHSEGELSSAAICYVLANGAEDPANDPSNEIWPWSKEWWKPSADPVRNLAKAGALIAAEIDRVQSSDPEHYDFSLGEPAIARDAAGNEIVDDGELDPPEA